MRTRFTAYDAIAVFKEMAVRDRNNTFQIAVACLRLRIICTTVKLCCIDGFPIQHRKKIFREIHSPDCFIFCIRKCLIHAPDCCCPYCIRTVNENRFARSFTAYTVRRQEALRRRASQFKITAGCRRFHSGQTDDRTAISRYRLHNTAVPAADQLSIFMLSDNSTDFI